MTTCAFHTLRPAITSLARKRIEPGAIVIRLSIRSTRSPVAAGQAHLPGSEPSRILLADHDESATVRKTVETGSRSVVRSVVDEHDFEVVPTR